LNNHPNSGNELRWLGVAQDARNDKTVGDANDNEAPFCTKHAEINGETEVTEWQEYEQENDKSKQKLEDVEVRPVTAFMSVLQAFPCLTFERLVADFDIFSQLREPDFVRFHICTLLLKEYD
jgi:hypothetical protein